MNKLCLPLSLILSLSGVVMPADAGQRNWLRSPEPGVLCDRYVCANDKGISRNLTERHLGKKAATKLFSQGDFDLTEFTFANGIFCDVKERLCRADRYYQDGKRSGAVSKKYTQLLFSDPHTEIPMQVPVLTGGGAEPQTLPRDGKDGAAGKNGENGSHSKNCNGSAGGNGGGAGGNSGNGGNGGNGGDGGDCGSDN